MLRLQLYRVPYESDSCPSSHSSSSAAHRSPLSFLTPPRCDETNPPDGTKDDKQLCHLVVILQMKAMVIGAL